MPTDLKRMLKHIYKSVGTKFDSDEQFKSIGAFLILRAINPSLVSPAVYALTNEPPKKSAQKDLMNISRILQNLANETSPSEKQPFLSAFDDFVETETTQMREFYKNIINFEGKVVESSSVLEVPNDVEMDYLAYLWNFLHQHKTQIQKGDVDGEFKNLFERIDAPIKKNK